MNPDLPRLTPGIVSIFFPLGYTVNVTELNDQIAVTLTRGDWSATKSFAYPAVNKDLSVQLMGWKAQLLSGDPQ